MGRPRSVCRSVSGGNCRAASALASASSAGMSCRSPAAHGGGCARPPGSEPSSKGPMPELPRTIFWRCSHDRSITSKRACHGAIRRPSARRPPAAPIAAAAGRPRQFLAALQRRRRGLPRGRTALSARPHGTISRPAGWHSSCFSFPEEINACSTTFSAFMNKRCCCTGSGSAYWPPTWPTPTRRIIKARDIDFSEVLAHTDDSAAADERDAGFAHHHERR